MNALPTMKNLHNPGLVSAGLAVRICCKSKAELVDMIRSFTADEKGDEAFVAMMDGIERSSDMFGAMVEVMECPTARVLSAASFIELEEAGTA
ncbi:hypothetical protein [Mesorhizobium sp. IMUNJ 23232]|uniref:hypothetical protein n=1 Tax=Mesorhizobium sp. IMUNJ 23232 TaxID=3376064 RepID=UPI0037906461